MSSIKTKFGKRVKEIRKNLGLTQEQLAERINIEPPNISKLEKGTHFPLPENVEKIAKALNVEIKDLFDFEHFNDNEKIKEKLKNYIDNANNKEVEFLYKTIVSLNEFKTN